MWGSWLGLVVGIIGAFSYGYGEPALLSDWMLFTIMGNPLIWLGFFLGEGGIAVLPLATLTTPIVMFLYGWGIHSLLRRFWRGGALTTSITIAILVVVAGVFVYVGNQMALRADTPYYDSSADTVLSVARDESRLIDVRLTALQALAPKVSGMTADQKRVLSDQLASFDTSRLSDMDRERVAGRITMLQNLLAK